MDAGLYNETAFRGLDFVLDQAAQYGVKVMFTLANNWKTFDSKYNVSLFMPPDRCSWHVCILLEHWIALVQYDMMMQWFCISDPMPGLLC